MNIELVKFIFLITGTLIVYMICKLPFSTDHVEIGQLIPKIWAVEAVEGKELIYFVWKYLKVSICKF